MEGEDAQPRALLFGQSLQGGWDHTVFAEISHKDISGSQTVPLGSREL